MIVTWLNSMCESSMCVQTFDLSFKHDMCIGAIFSTAYTAEEELHKSANEELKCIYVIVIHRIAAFPMNNRGKTQS